MANDISPSHRLRCCDDWLGRLLVHRIFETGNTFNNARGEEPEFSKSTSRFRIGMALYARDLFYSTYMWHTIHSLGAEEGSEAFLGTYGGISHRS